MSGMLRSLEHARITQPQSERVLVEMVAMSSAQLTAETSIKTRACAAGLVSTTQEVSTISSLRHEHDLNSFLPFYGAEIMAGSCDGGGSCEENSGTVGQSSCQLSQSW